MSPDSRQPFTFFPRKIDLGNGGSAIPLLSAEDHFSSERSVMVNGEVFKLIRSRDHLSVIATTAQGFGFLSLTYGHQSKLVSAEVAFPAFLHSRHIGENTPDQLDKSIDLAREIKTRNLDFVINFNPWENCYALIQASKPQYTTDVPIYPIQSIFSRPYFINPGTYLYPTVEFSESSCVLIVAVGSNSFAKDQKLFELNRRSFSPLLMHEELDLNNSRELVDFVKLAVQT